MELKLTLQVFKQVAGVCPNRTFMELKSQIITIFVCWFACPNRTFMELKLNWKWNTSRSGTSQSHLYGIEIYYSDKVNVYVPSPNRTFMELKCVVQPRRAEEAAGPNRTFMELKY